MKKKQETKRIIFTNEIDFDHYNDQYFIDLLGIDEAKNLTDDQKNQYISDDVCFWLESEQDALFKPTNTILCICNMGLWNGRKIGYKFLDNNLNSIFDVMNNYDYVNFYCDRYDVKADLSHHDGTNYCTFRELKDNISDEVIERIENALYNNDMDKIAYYISKYTRSLKPYIKQIYGW